MRCLPFAGVAFLLALTGCDNSQAPNSDPAAAYQETVRCYNAAANYAQQYVVAGVTDKQTAMLGYAAELRSRAYTLGARLGKSPATIKADFRDDDSAYLRRFYVFQAGTMTLTEFGNGEITHCALDRALPQ